MGIEYLELPFRSRPDLTPYLIHLTRNTEEQNGNSAYDNLLSILKTGKIWGSNYKGYIKGKGNTAACFMDIPFFSLKYVLNQEKSSDINPRYEPYGIFIEKNLAYEKGIRPVSYLSNEEKEILKIPEQELWRVVRLEVHNNDWISWVHEREWRCQGDFDLPQKERKNKENFKLGVLVKSFEDVIRLQKDIRKKSNNIFVDISVILPLDIICQGLYI